MQRTYYTINRFIIFKTYNTNRFILGICGCDRPFTHFKFPTSPDQKKQWIKLINRQKSSDNKSVWLPTNSSVVCSEHFMCGKPTVEYPDPTLKLGYKHTMQSHCVRLPPSKRRSAVDSDKPTSVITDQPTTTPISPTVQNFSVASTSSEACNPEMIYRLDGIEPNEPSQPSENWIDIDSNDHPCLKAPTQQGSSTSIIKLRRQLRKVTGQYMVKTLALKKATNRLAFFLQPTYKTLLRNDKLCRFYTGIPKLVVFNAVCTYIEHVITSEQPKQHHPRKRNRLLPRKLSVQNSVLLTLMKLRLGLLNTDLAER